MRERKVKRLFLVGGVGFVVMVLCAGALALYATHGILWSLDMPVYGQMLRSLPTPPGVAVEGDRMDLTPYHQWGARYYHVDMDHPEVVRFFKENLPPRGWVLEREISHLQGTMDMLFRYQQYWLYVEVQSIPRPETDSSFVDLAISKDKGALLRLGGWEE